MAQILPICLAGNLAESYQKDSRRVSLVCTQHKFFRPNANDITQK
jgi:hypothetical protein